MKTTKITSWHIALILAAIAVWLTSSDVPQTRKSYGSPPACVVYFSPHGGATPAIIEALDGAKRSVLVQAYSFTSLSIAEELVKAHERGVRVQVLLDKSQRTQRLSVAELLIRRSITTLIDDAHAIAHDKVMIIDDEIVITGSFNFTKSAEERNSENLLILRSKELAARYVDNWQSHQKHSTPFR